MPKRKIVTICLGLTLLAGCSAARSTPNSPLGEGGTHPTTVSTTLDDPGREDSVWLTVMKVDADTGEVDTVVVKHNATIILKTSREGKVEQTLTVPQETWDSFIEINRHATKPKSSSTETVKGVYWTVLEGTTQTQYFVDNVPAGMKNFIAFFDHLILTGTIQ